MPLKASLRRTIALITWCHLIQLCWTEECGNSEDDNWEENEDGEKVWTSEVTKYAYDIILHMITGVYTVHFSMP